MRKIALIFIPLLVVFLYACANGEVTTKQRQQYYRDSAKQQERSAEDWRNRNIEYMAEYHEEEANKSRHNEHAEGCGIFDIIIFEILLDGDECEHKH